MYIYSSFVAMTKRWDQVPVFETWYGGGNEILYEYCQLQTW
jgi:hypothetical protein